MVSSKKKVMLIGAQGYRSDNVLFRLDSYAWDELSKISNIRDHDIVIISLLSLTEEKRKLVVWNDFAELINFSNCLDIIMNGGKIFVIGDPRFDIHINRITKYVLQKQSIHTVHFLFWTGLLFEWDESQGDSKHVEHYSFEQYMKYLVKWKYTLIRTHFNNSIVRWHKDYYLAANGLSISHRTSSICTNKLGNDIAFKITYDYRDSPRMGPCAFEAIVVLPEINLSEEETLKCFLRTICDIEVSCDEPEWVRTVVAPMQSAHDNCLENIERKMRELESAYNETTKKRQECRKYLKLLYEIGIPLEKLVRDVLRELGATVTDPPESEPNKEDGWIKAVVNGADTEGVLEVKGTKSNTFNDDGRKQLLEWIDRGRVSARRIEFKGIFIGNSSVTKPLVKRIDAFSDNWKSAAQMSGICALKTEDLYVIYVLHKANKLDGERFWKDVFDTKGIFDMTKYWKLVGTSINDENKWDIINELAKIV